MRKEIKAFFAVLISLMSSYNVNAQQSGLSPDLQKIIWAECAKLSEEEYQKQLAFSIYLGVVNYFNTASKNP